MKLFFMQLTVNNYLYKLILFLFLALITSGLVAQTTDNSTKAAKLYWFIPDGVRAEPDVFTFFKWAQEGKLPNIKKMMDNGSYGYSIPVFPTHTPVNFATLLTGSYPKTHGIADGPMHIEGYELNTISAGGFRSVSRKVPAIWTIMENVGKKVFVLTTPGSTPPEIQDGYILRGRWGGWGADVQALNFESKTLKSGIADRDIKLFNVGAELTKFTENKTTEIFPSTISSYSPVLESELNAWGCKISCYIADTSNNNIKDYSKFYFSTDNKTILASVKPGEWSNWVKVLLDIGGKTFLTDCMFRAIKLNNNGDYRLRIVFNNLNKFITQPDTVANNFTEHLGPMIAFVDNFPPQLIYYPEDKKVFLEEMNKSFSWHIKAVPYINKVYKPDVVIHDNYNPNQMLTSKWWMGLIDPNSIHYAKADSVSRAVAMQEVMAMYLRLDSIVGKIMETTDSNTLIVFSSDHGICAKNKNVKINNLLASKGFLKFDIDSISGTPKIDWKNTHAIFLQMIGVYINPEGLDGKWIRASGKDYNALRDSVINALSELKDSDGTCPVSSITKWEDVEEKLFLPKDKVGDLVISNKPGYGWTEAMSKDLKYFEISPVTGYKQAILPSDTKGIWTPFIIMGPGIKKGYEIKEPIIQTSQLPTILNAMGIEIPDYVDGKIIKEIFIK